MELCKAGVRRYEGWGNCLVHALLFKYFSEGSESTGDLP